MSALPSDPETPRLVNCPQCGQDSVYAPSNPYRPFCSKRCKLIDLGAWSSESYRVAQPPGENGHPEDGFGDDGQ